ncbi:hypothetical protein GcC1_184047 [Golovinomyces cichoracearum]|uniref:Uncharacterized protein n=1 Tax=Golovinomyces cichoracearum TaxID=62708 RepID=A0A420HLD1_9PEZI|nr:hypothetical protein GcC1_184047 [Golovinomyces cichoracearum]
MIRTREVVFKEDLYDSLKDITLGQLVDEKQHLVTLNKIEVPKESITLELDPYICSRIPLFQVENDFKSRQVDNKFQVTENINVYPTQSPTASREQTFESEDINLELVDNFNVLHNKDVASANVYLEAFSHTLSENIKIHRDQLPLPPKK